MARHSRNSSFTKASIGAGAVATVVAVPLIAMQAPAWAVDCDSYAADIVGTDYLTVNDLGNGVCEFVFANEQSMDSDDEVVEFSNFEIPEGVQKLGILAVSPGRNASSDNYTAGGGGTVTYTELSVEDEDVFPGTLEGYAGGVNWDSGSEQWDVYLSWVALGANNWDIDILISVSAEGTDSYQYVLDNDNPYFLIDDGVVNTERICRWDPDGPDDRYYYAGAGTAEDAGADQELLEGIDCLGGAGVSPAELVDLGWADSDLWAVNSDTEYGAGGSVLWEDAVNISTYEDVAFGKGGDLYVGTDSVPLGDPDADTWPIGKNPGTGAIIIRMLFNDGPATYSGAQVYDGPSGLYTEKSVPVRSTGKATGAKLDTVSEILIGGNRVDFELQPDGSIVFETPDVDPGRYTITYVIAPGNVRLGDVINLVENNNSTTTVSTGASYLRSKVFANYRGDSGVVLPADRAAISAFLSQYSNITHVTCVGSTSGVPAAPTDQALANSRAANACGVAESLVPNATIREVGVTGRGVGQAFRSVTIYVRGLK